MAQSRPQLISGPRQLPVLVTGQKIQSGPYTVTVTDDMVVERDRQNEQLYRAWLSEQQRRMHAEGEDGEDYVGAFKDATVRKIFVRKVFCVLTLQLIFTFAVIACFMFVSEARKLMMLHGYLWIIAFVVFTIFFCAISCSYCARRQAPYNYICLFFLTAAMSYLAAFVSVIYSVECVLLAIGMTAIVTLLIGFVATCSKFDLTMRPGLLLVFGLVSIVCLLVTTTILMFTYIRVLHIIISIIGTLLLSLYLYFDIQTIMGGRRVELSPDEVIYAATQLYVDIVLLYQYILMFMGIVHDG